MHNIQDVENATQLTEEQKQRQTELSKECTKKYRLRKKEEAKTVVSNLSQNTQANERRGKEEKQTKTKIGTTEKRTESKMETG